MKNLIFVLFLGLFALVAKATPVYDTSQSAISIGRPEGAVFAIAVSDYTQPALTFTERNSFVVVTLSDQNRATQANAISEGYSLRTDERLCNPDLKVYSPPNQAELAAITNLPRVSQIYLYGMHRTCTIRLCRLSSDSRRVT